jgi:serine protease
VRASFFIAACSKLTSTKKQERKQPVRRTVMKRVKRTRGTISCLPVIREALNRAGLITLLGIILLCLVPLYFTPQAASASDQPVFETYQGVTPLDDSQYAPDQVIVKFKVGASSASRTALNSSLGALVLYSSPLDKFEVIQIPSGKTVPEMIAAYIGQANVEYVEPNYIAHAAWSPNDTYYNLQWHFNQINMGSAWDLDTTAPLHGGDPGIVVAIVDSGAAYENYGPYQKAPDLANTNFTTGYDFINNDAHPNDDYAHGTHVCGTIAQSTNNSLGVAGIAFNSTIMPVKVLDSNGSGTYAQIANGIYYAVDHGANIINLSIGGTGNSSTLENAVAYAYNHGVTVICAAGNLYEEGNTPVYPAAYDAYCIAAGATRYDQTRAPYSNTGSYIDLVAPGGDYSVDQNGDSYGDGILQQTFNPNTKDPTDFGYWFYQGTSQACAHTTGVAALILAKHPDWTPLQVRQALQSTATDLGAAGKDDAYGWGLLNATSAISATSLEKVIGTETPATSSTSGNRLILGRFQAEKTGHITQIWVYSVASGHVKGAVYDDSGGSPTTLLNANNSSTAVIGGYWNPISIPSTAVTAGHYYWLAAANDTSGAISYGPAGSSDPSKGSAITFSSFSFTSNPTGLTSYTYQRPFAGWGDTTPPPLAVTTNAATAVGNGTATLNGTLTSLGMDTSAVVAFGYGGSVDYSDLVEADQSPMSAPGDFSVTLTGLTNGQTYHFAAAAGGLPSSAIVVGEDMTFTPNVPPQKLIGSDTPATSSTAGNRLILGRFQAAQTGHITQIRLYSLASGNVKVAVYNDSGGSPTTLAYHNDTPTTVTGGQWNAIPIASTAITAGNYYWLAAANDLSGAISYGPAGSSDPSKGKAITFSSFNFTDNPTGLTSYTYQRPFAGWGDTTPPPLAVTTNAATAVGNGMATLNGTLTGLGTDLVADIYFQYGTDTSYGIDITPDVAWLSSLDSFSVTLSSLTNGQTYHFRAAAAGSPSSTTVYGGDMTFTPNAEPQKLIGSDIPATSSTGGNRLILGRFQAAQTGHITQIRLYSLASGQVKVAVYNDSGGSPTTLAYHNDTPTAVTGGQWNAIPIASTAVSAGNYYWLAAANDLSGAISYGPAGSSDPSKGKAITFSSFNFTDNPTGLTSYTYQRPFAGWGDTTPPPLAVITTSGSKSGDTYTLCGSLRGLGSDDSAVVYIEYGADTSYGNTVAADQSPMESPGDFCATFYYGGQTCHSRACATGSPSSTTVCSSDIDWFYLPPQRRYPCSISPVLPLPLTVDRETP